MSWNSYVLDELAKLAAAVPVVDETDAQIRENLRKKYKVSPFLAGSLATGLSIPGKADYDYGLTVKSLPKFRKLVDRLKQEAKPSPFNVPGTDYHVFQTEVGGKPVDLSLMYGEKGRQQREAIQRAAAALTPEEKQRIIQKKRELKDSWFFPETRYKMYKREIDKKLGLPRFQRDPLPGNVDWSPNKLFGHRTANLEPIVQSGEMLSAAEAVRRGKAKPEDFEANTGGGRKLLQEVFLTRGGMLPAGHYGNYGVLLNPDQQPQYSRYLNAIPNEHVLPGRASGTMNFVVPDHEVGTWRKRFPNHVFHAESEVPKRVQLPGTDSRELVRRLFAHGISVRSDRAAVAAKDLVPATAGEKRASAGLASLLKQADLNPDVKLRPHQQEAVNMLLRSGNRALFAHATGTGKTLSAIAGFERMREKGQATKALVITPASLQSNFAEKGVKKFTNSTVGPLGSDSHYQMTTLEKFRKNPAKALETSGADTLIVDEIHRAKDQGSKSFKSLLEASQHPQVKNVIGLTGSFISNHPSEVVPLMDIIRPEHELGSITAFKRRFTKSEEVPGGFLVGPRQQTTLKNEKRLQTAIGPGMHYVGHNELSGLPRMTIKDVHLQMTAEQKKLYDFSLGGLSEAEREKIKKGLPPSQSEAQHIFARIMKARQASNSVGTHLQMKAADSAERTPKLKKIMDDVEEHLKKTPDGQAVIYSNLVKGGAIELYHGLKQRGYDPGVYAGEGAVPDMDKKVREQHLDDFLKGKRKIMILTPAGGEGVSLNNATFLAMADHFYNPEKNWQAIARGRRLGGQAQRAPQDRHLEVRRYYSDPKQNLWSRLVNREVGVDEWIQRVADEKDRLNNEMKNTVRYGRKV